MFEFWRFKAIDHDTYQLIATYFDAKLIVLSVVVAIFASYSTLVILSRIWVAENHNIIKVWLLFGSFVMGIGVWAMHFTGMLAYIMPVPMSFDPWITTLSILPIFIGTYFTLRQMSLHRYDFFNLQISALSLTLGIGAMHFIGMEAMQSNVKMVYDFSLFVTSLVIAHLLATIALYLIVLIDRIKQHLLSAKIICAIVMGSAVASMHYTAMWSASIYLANNTLLQVNHVEHNSLIIAGVIAGIIALLLVTTILYALIDQRLQAAEVLARDCQIRQNDIIEHLADGLLIIDKSGLIVSANSAALRMFNLNSSTMEGYKIEQLIPSITYKQLVDDIGLFDHIFLGQTVIIEGVKINGEKFPIEAHFSKMTLVIDFQVMFNCVLRDITERVRLEKQLNQAQKLESIGQLAAGIAHEINTPTQYVTDNTSFLKTTFSSCLSVLKASQTLSNMTIEQVSEQDLVQMKKIIEDADIDFISEEIPLALEQALEGLQRISTIVGAMKSFSHPSKGEMQLTKISEAIQTTITVARNEWRYVAELSTQFDDSIPKIMCIRDELNQVFLNIIVNAAHAIEERQKYVSEDMGKITITAYQQQEYVVVEISDNGAGMSAEVKHRMFDHFYTTKGVGKGTGQGLSLAYSVIVDGHHGKITADSVVNKGTTFKIYLPIEHDLNQQYTALQIGEKAL